MFLVVMNSQANIDLLASKQNSFVSSSDNENNSTAEINSANIIGNSQNNTNVNGNQLFTSFRNIIRRSLDLTSLEMMNNNSEGDDTLKSDTNNTLDSKNLSKLKFSFQSLDLYNRLHSSQLITRKSKEDQESDSEPKSTATIAKSVAPRSNSTTPTQHRKRLGNNMLAINGSRVYMRVLYDSNTHVLTVTIIQANKLVRSQPADQKQKQLFQTNKIQFHLSLANKEKSHKYKTSPKEFADLIDFNETFYFPNIFENDLNEDAIQLHVYSKEKFSSDRIILQSSYLLSKLNLKEQFNYITLYLEKPLTPNLNLDLSTGCFVNGILMNSVGEKAQLYLGLKYDALMGSLTLNIIKACSLYDPFTMDKSPSTFVRLLLKLEKKESKYETAVKKSTSSPVFEESFEFNIATFQVENAELFIYVYSKRVLTGKNLIGFISFDDQPGNDEYLKHLREALTDDSGEFINKWHSLLACQ